MSCVPSAGRPKWRFLLWDSVHSGAGLDSTDSLANIGAAEVESLRQAVVSTLVGRLRAAGLWLSDNELQRFAQEQWATGRRLERELVIPLLVAKDHAYLAQPPAGRFFGRPRIRLPLILGFGYECGWWLHAALNAGDEGRDAAARTCGVFNLGISLVDRVCDRSGSATLTHILDETSLGTLWHSAGTDDYLARVSSQASTPELRLLIAMVVLFFAKVRRLVAGDQACGAGERLERLLLEAYRAELTSVSVRRVADTDALRIAAASKSELPFEIMLAVAQLAQSGRCAAREATATNMAQLLGSVFSLADDLSDLSRDYRTGDANAILLLAGNSRTIGAAAGEAADRLVRTLDSSLHQWQSQDAAERQRFRSFLLGSVQGWLSGD